MNKLKLTYALLPLCISATLAIPAQADEIYVDHQQASAKETGGFGLGILLGAVVGGPPGAILGAAGGAWLGHHDTQRTNTIAAKNSELVEKENQITKLETELSVTENELANTISRLNSDQRLVAMDFLKKGMTTTVYFRSDEVDLPDTNADRLYQLAQLLRSYPELHISMEGHADIRGDGEYNQHLSELRVETVQDLLEDAGIPTERIHCQAYGELKAMAAEGDNENYVFDRRVSIHISLVTNT